MDYKAKYLKYKNKYLNLNLNLQKGGFCITQKCKLREELKKAGFKDYFIDEYSNEIDKGDLDFFINNDYKTKNVLFQKDSSKIIFDKIECLREPVSRLDPSEKAKIVKYLQNLKGLSDVYDSMKNN